MLSFSQNSVKNSITITRDKRDFITLYDVEYTIYDLQLNANESYQMQGLNFNAMCTIYSNWCKMIRATWINIGSMFEPHRFGNESWSDLDGISIDDDEIIP